MDFGDDEHIDVCQNIEVGLKREYELHPEMSDILCVFALEGAKTAIKKHFGYARNEKACDHPLAKGIIEWCIAIGVERIGKVNDLTLQDFLTRIEKVKRSVKRHSAYGTRGYYEFIKDFV